MLSVRSLFGEDAHILRERDFQLLLLANLVAPLGTALVSPLLDSLQAPYGATEATIGLMMTAYTAPGIVMIPLIGVLADRYGRKPILVLGLLLFSVAGIAMAATTDFRFVLGLRFAQGIGFAAVTPIIITSIGDLYTGTAEATGQGFRFTCSGLSQTLFPLVGGILVTVAWQYPLLFYAIGIPIALVTAVYFEEPARGSTAESDLSGAYLRELLSLVGHPRVAAVLFLRTLPVFLYILFMTYVSLLLGRNLGGTPGEAGALVALASVTYAGSSTQLGRMGTSFEGRVAPLAAAIFLMMTGLVAVAFAPLMAVAVAGVLALGLGFGVGLSLMRSIVTGFAPTELRGGLVSLAESFGRLSATCAPVVIGALIGSVGRVLDTTAALQTTIAGVAVVASLLGFVALGVGVLSPAVDGRPDADPS